MNKMHRRGVLVAWLLTMCSAGLGCAPEVTAPRDLVVTSDPAQGRLAVIEYADGARVLFLREADGGLSVAARFATARGNPLEGVDTERLAPSDVFTHLAGRPAPDALLAAEREAGVASEPDALARLRARADLGSDIGQATQAWTVEEFVDRYGGHEVCLTNRTGNQSIHSSMSGRKTRVVLNVVSGTVDLLVERTHFGLLGTEVSTLVVEDETYDRTFTTGAIRRDWAVTTRIPLGSAAVYHLAINFDRHR